MRFLVQGSVSHVSELIHNKSTPLLSHEQLATFGN
jgi:hypothetical protein